MDTLSKQNKILIGISLMVLAGLLFWWGKTTPQKSSVKETPLENIEIASASEAPAPSKLNIENLSYAIPGKTIELKNGESKLPIANTKAFLSTKLIDGTAYSDIDADGIPDAVVLLRNDAGGPSVFYYTAVVLSNNGKPTVSKARLIGDRIRIQEITILKNIVMIDIRVPGEDASYVGVPDTARALVFEVAGGELVLK